MNRTFLSCALILIGAARVFAQDGLPEAIRGVTIEQKLNSSIDPSLIFRNELGERAALKQYLGRRPIVLALVYYNCPSLCNLILNGVLRVSRTLKLSAGKDYDVVAVSIDPRETPELAAAKWKSYVQKYGRPTGTAGWHFLTGDEPSIRALADAVGYRYRFDKESGTYSHASGLIVITPEGRVSRYLFGVEYSARDLRLALVEASRGRIGTPIDQILLYCFHYDPQTGKYGVVIMNVLRLGGLLTLAALAAFWLVMYRRRRAEVRP